MPNISYQNLPEAGLTLICGRPQTGKTSLALELAGQALEAEKSVLYLSLDGGRDVMPSPIPDGLTVDTAESKEPDEWFDYILDTINSSEDLDDVVVDYLQMIDHDGEKNALEKLAKLAKEKELRLLVLSQLNKKVEHLPVLENLQSMGINTVGAEAVVFVCKNQNDNETKREASWVNKK